jgi:hypothetical protein
MTYNFIAKQNNNIDHKGIMIGRITKLKINHKK